MLQQTSVKRGTATGIGKKRKNKYNAKGQYEIFDGKKTFFHSQAEAVRFKQLLKLREENLITKLELQPKFPCIVNNRKVCEYRGDFSYYTKEINEGIGYRIIEDVKGQVTDTYKIKKPLVEALYGIKINEIPSKEVDKWENIIPKNN